MGGGQPTTCRSARSTCSTIRCWSARTSSRGCSGIGELVSDVIDRVPKLGYLAAYAKQEMRDKLIEHKQYITRYGDDMPEVKQWRWPEPAGV
jgi:XFP C-terminal domain